MRRLKILPPPIQVVNAGIVRLLGRSVTMMAVALGLCLTACHKNLWNTVNDLENRVTALEEWQNQVNSNIAAIQTLLNTSDYITSVTEISSNGEVIGYRIEFLNSDAITIYNGTQGETGETPQIGLTQGEDGNWYWTLNGELMTDSNGNPIRANGEDGADGQDGATGATGATGASAPTPQIKLGSTITSGTCYGLNGTQQSTPDADAWYLSVDNGETWYRVTGATGETGANGQDGDSFFKSVDYTSYDDYVVFTLADESTFTVAKYKGNLLTFYWNEEELTDLTQILDVSEGDLTYTVTGSYDVSVRILEGDDWSATAMNGTMTILGVYSEEALLEIILTENGKVIETYRLTVTQSYYLSGRGTAANPYRVSSKDALEYLAAQSTEENSYFSDKHFALTTEIDLNGEEVMISTFSGTFDGNEHTIKNLTIDQGETDDYVGLISRLSSGGEVRNLNLESVKITGKNRVGGVVGYNATNSTVTACNVSGSVFGGNNFVGGVVGYNYGTVTDCSVSGSVSGSWYVGGVVGYNATNSTVTACSASGSVSGGNNFVGGVVGYNNTNGTVTACYHISGDVSSSGYYVGGVVGFNFGTVTACYHASGSISGTFAGGVVGNNGDNGTVTACYWSDHTGNGIGTGSGNGTPTKVNDDDWSNAVTGMNNALQTNSSEWRYEILDGNTYPTLTKSSSSE